MFQHTAARRRLAVAATIKKTAKNGFNTQPPEGGWRRIRTPPSERRSFNTQPPEGGWRLLMAGALSIRLFQHTAARRRLDMHGAGSGWVGEVSTHSRPKAAGNTMIEKGKAGYVSTHSRPKAAGCTVCTTLASQTSFNTQPPEGGWAFFTPKKRKG